MSKPYELTYTQLKNKCTEDTFSFRTTAELEPLDDIIGQDRAVQALDFGLAVKMKGYNIYMSGPSGTGKTTHAKKSALKRASTEPVPQDWCYVHNFEDEKCPLALSFPAGVGRKFRKDMETLIQLCQSELQKAFSSDAYDSQKSAITRSIDEKEKELIESMNALGEEYGFAVRSTEAGLYFLPVVDGEPLEDAAYEALPEKQRESIDRNSLLIQEKVAPIVRQFGMLEKEAKERQEALDQKVGTYAIERHIQTVQNTYADSQRAVDYLTAVQADILCNLSQFLNEEEAPADGLAVLLGGHTAQTKEEITDKYKINLIVDHTETKGAPVIVTFSPTCSNLMGEVEYNSDGNSLTTDYSKIKGGLLHQANGGYLLVQAHDILSAPNAWDALRRVIKTGEINMDSLRETAGTAVLPILKPEPIPANMKIIMIGSRYYYELLSAYDEEFDKFFKIRADFDDEMPRTRENLIKIAQFVKSFVEREETPEFDASAVCAVVEYASRSAERQDRLSTRFNYLAEVLSEAVTWALLEGVDIVTAVHVRKAIAEKEQRMKLYEEKLAEMLEENVIMIATDGSAVGQINGLAVLDMGAYAFGTPTRITATTYVGKSGIVNIEKEARMSGQTHDKGVQIITGFLGQTYAQKFPMSLSCRVCFEQNYNGIDGDSASSTELYCILSSLADLPIRQDLAVTGSVNQKGEIQAIGGVTYKIEGFFDLCNKRGLTGTQGVIIPAANVRDLVLKDDVITAVREGKFHIYPITHINQGLELLLSCPAGEKNNDGLYPENTVHGKAYARLREFNEAAHRR